MGVWLPLALADITALMFATIRMWAAKPDEVKVPKRSELLKGWALPFTASALKAEEEEQEALALFNSVKNLQAKQEAKNANPQPADMTSRPPAGATPQEAPQPANTTSRPPAGATPQDPNRP